MTSLSMPADKVPMDGDFSGGFKMVFSETPAHGMDLRRNFARNTGFLMFSSNFSQDSTSNPMPYYLQTIRDLSAADGGSVDCGIAQ
jgi:hypothetical protein